MKTLFLFFFIILFTNSKDFTVVSEKFYKNCKIELAKDIGNNRSSANTLKDSVYILENKLLSIDYVKVFDVYNTKNTNIYLYTGLVHPDWIRQPYVHQYDSSNHEYLFSLTPLYKYFRNDFLYNTLLDADYNWYSFVELKPNKIHRLTFAVGNAYFKRANNGILSINPFNMKEALSSRYITLDSCTINSAIIRMGYYNQIDSLCTKKEFREIESFNDKVNFKVISVKFSYWGGTE